MTRAAAYRQVLAQLRQTPRDWCLVGGCIRRRRGAKAQCPVSSLTGAASWDVYAVGAKLGLPAQLVSDLVASSDDWFWDRPDMRMRRDLLRACGLPVPSRRERV